MKFDMRSLLMTFASIMVFCASPLWARDLAAPQDEVVLTVSGAIDVTNVEDTAQFDMAMLKAMNAVTFDTTTLWTEGTRTFVDVPLAHILDLLGVEDGMILVSAINDYTVEIPVDSLTETAPILAYSQDGKQMARRQKGPLWVIYPYDSDASFRSELVYSRSIWQLTRLEVVR